MRNLLKFSIKKFSFVLTFYETKIAIFSVLNPAPEIAFGIILIVFSFETFVISVNGITAEVSHRRIVE